MKPAENNGPDAPTAHTVAWFPPQRPTDGNTLFLRPDGPLVRVEPDDRSHVRRG